ncbi:DUF6446 family protein [Rubellimicrobium sp. CFH 75288]|uniref:DUF6446 family protein n=1 Tax=Rubellimicrobium sp. CFH 75288 TaxID=2697034 RepID=UPI001FB81EA9|nr:DUF6446 family protein [Rubellimicrobium sp. CFH 75288]
MTARPPPGQPPARAGLVAPLTPARLLVLGLLLTALVAGAAMWWLQTRAFYREVSADAVLLARPGGAAEAVPAEGFRGIDSDSSPIRFRACATLPPQDPVALLPYPFPRPLVAPGWFDCFDARAIGEALERGEARAVLSEAGVVRGVDRVAALFPDGRVFLWTQLDPCGPLAEESDRPRACPPSESPP